MNFFCGKEGWLLATTFLFSIGIFAQHTGQQDTTHTSHGMKGSHRLTIGMGHTHLSQGEIEGRTEWLPIASWTLNYDYWLSKKWAIGLQNDMIMETFIVKHEGDKEIERKNPLAMVPVAMYKFGKHFSGIGGVGIEFSEGHNLVLTRIGFEYGWHLPNHFEAGLAAVWDNKWGYYNSWGLAFTFSKIWPHHKQPHTR
jgi:hypothetical protein